jgi:hypothetical protein
LAPTLVMHKACETKFSVETRKIGCGRGGGEGSRYRITALGRCSERVVRSAVLPPFGGVVESNVWCSRTLDGGPSGQP